MKDTAWRISIRGMRIALYGVVGMALLYGVFSLVVRPSLDRNWSPDMQVLAHATFDGDLVHVTNIRNNDYTSTTTYEARYYDKTFDLSKIESVWYMVEPFSDAKAGAAHTLVSFGFEDGEYLAISAEIRREVGEEFSPIRGLFRQYELVYVVADERDVIKLRSNYRKDPVYLYPVTATKEQMRTLFVSMLTRANTLGEKPEFYNTLTNTCTTNIVRHVNEIAPRFIPLSYKVLLPEYSDELAYRIGLLDATHSLEELRALYQINDRALRFADDEAFSLRIRGK